MIMAIKMIEMYNIAAQPYYHAPLTYLLSKRRRFITSYVQPIIQQYKSTTS